VMKKVVVWICLCAASVILLLFSEYYFIPLSLMFMIGFHELGHLWTAKYLGIKTGGFYFIPAIGGAAIIEELPQKRWHNFWIIFNGPLVGLGLTLILIVVNLFLNKQILWATAFFWAAANLFNLLAVNPLDGSKIVWSIVSDSSEYYLEKSLAYHVCKWISLLIICSMSFLFAFLIMIFSDKERAFLIEDWKRKDCYKEPMTHKQRCVAVVLFIALIASLVISAVITTYF